MQGCILSLMQVKRRMVLIWLGLLEVPGRCDRWVMIERWWVLVRNWCWIR